MRIKNRKLRFVLILLASTVVGGVVGFLVAYFRLENIDLGISQKMVHAVLSPVTQIFATISLLIGVYFFYCANKEYKVYEETENDDSSEDMYRSLNRKYAKTSVFIGIASTFATFGIFSGLFLFFEPNGAILTIPILDYILLFLSQYVQVKLMKFYGKMRGVDIPSIPTLKELKNNILQQDEAELQANYKLSFDIVMNLSGLIIPTIYICLFLLSFLTKRVELTGIAVAAAIHLYIMVMNFKMVKEYYK